ncbi:hypothetical protein PUN28_000619 [Cardiocondyla obscurior]|uniref:Uncharacterized protein n=1 Tax=Cardiocondyla obscurior TaxID=286306 RepID=A0AAW2H0B1_9HYME
MDQVAAGVRLRRESLCVYETSVPWIKPYPSAKEEKERRLNRRWIDRRDVSTTGESHACHFSFVRFFSFSIACCCAARFPELPRIGGEACVAFPPSFTESSKFIAITQSRWDLIFERFGEKIDLLII